MALAILLRSLTAALWLSSDCSRSRARSCALSLALVLGIPLLLHPPRTHSSCAAPSSSSHPRALAAGQERQEHGDPADRALLRPRRRECEAGRHGPAAAQHLLAEEADRAGRAGAGAVCRYDCGEHRVRQGGRDDGRDRAGARLCLTPWWQYQGRGVLN
eukprot:3778472-Rhodomonas_salina.1